MNNLKDLTFKETIKLIRDEIKKTFPDFKFSITARSYRSIDVDILSGTIDFGQENRGVNQYHLDTQWTDHPIALEFLTKINNIIKQYHWDESDSMTDYFHCAFYYHISIGGGYDKPYKLIMDKAA